MVLVDTSVWASHLRTGDTHLKSILQDGEVVCHPFIIGELSCGNIKNRNEVISLLQALPTVKTSDHDEILHFIEAHHLMGIGLGLIDVHLLASAILSDVLIWTYDKKLNQIAVEMGISHASYSISE